jgi:hypothetical protein
VAKTIDKVELAWAEVDPRVIANPTLAAVKAYWDEKRGTRKMPARADISPVDLREHLGWIMMIEVLPDCAEFRYKLIGTKVTRYFVTNSTGRTVSEAFGHFGPGAVKGVQAVYRKAAREHVPTRAFGEANWLVDWKMEGRGFPNFDSLYLPLSDDGVTANMLLSVFTFDYARVLEQCESVLG